MMNPDKIEIIVEREMNKLDRRLLAGKIAQEEYDREITKLDKWADKQYNKVM